MNNNTDFTPVERFEHDGYFYDEKADTNVLEYLYPVADKFCPDFDEDTNNAPSQAVSSFVRRYNYLEDSKRGKFEKPDFSSTSNFEKRMLKIGEYQKVINRNNSSNLKEPMDIQEYLELFQLDSEKFWYLFLFISDYVEGLCLNNMQVDDSVLEQVKEFISYILPNSAHDDDTALSLKMNVTFGKKHSLKIDEVRTISFLAHAAREQLKMMDINNSWITVA